jgi:hypothetical protein
MLASLIAAALAVFATPQDCSIAGEVGARVCTTASLKSHEIELAAKEARVLAVTARPATWRARAAQFRKWLAQPDLDGQRPSDEILIQRLQDQVLELDKEIDRARGLSPVPDEATALGSQCLARWLHMGCRVTASGILRGEDGTRIVWQRQAGASDVDGIGNGILLWDASKPGAPKLIGWSFEGVNYEAPILTDDRKLWVPGSMAGSGGGNADLLYVRRDGQWVEIETTSWRDTLEDRLPKGFSAWQGIDYDFNGMGGRSPLWRDTDANCCASGGSLTLGFSIRGTSLILDEVDPDIVEKWAPEKK